jgi:hypothetical protein
MTAFILTGKTIGGETSFEIFAQNNQQNASKRPYVIFHKI